jgi:hypothetical protein
MIPDGALTVFGWTVGAATILAFLAGVGFEVTAERMRRAAAAKKFEEEMRAILFRRHGAAGPWYSVQEDGLPRGAGEYLVVYWTNVARRIVFVAELYCGWETDADSDKGRRWGLPTHLQGEVTHWANIHLPEVAKKAKAAG